MAVFKVSSGDVGIDLGTANTLVYVRGKGVVVNEPSVVALNEKTGQVVAVGGAAKTMLGRTPQHIRAVRPLVGGVISDFEITEELIAYLLKKAESKAGIIGPRVVIGIPTGITNVEQRAVRDAAKNAGAREVYLVEETIAGAVGARLPIREAIGTMVIDIGGGTTDIATLSLGGTVSEKGTRVAGDAMNAAIVEYVRNEFGLVIGEKTAEDLKIAIGSFTPLKDPLEAPIRGRDIVTGLPREIVLTDAQVRSALSPLLDSLVETIKEVVEETPPEILSDIVERGVFLFGGGALIRGIREALERALGVPVKVVADPFTAVVRGTGAIVENISAYKDMIVPYEAELAPKV
jgi:rod shape-determining protein MreB